MFDHQFTLCGIVKIGVFDHQFTLCGIVKIGVFDHHFALCGIVRTPPLLCTSRLARLPIVDLVTFAPQAIFSATRCFKLTCMLLEIKFYLNRFIV